MRGDRRALGLRVWLVLLSQIYLIGGLLLIATYGLFRPESDLLAIVAVVGAAALVAAALLLWWRGTSWPMRVLNAIVVAGFVYALPLLVFSLSAGGAFGVALLAIALAGAIVSVVVGGASPQSP